VNDLYYIAYEPKVMYLDTSDMTCEGERAHRRLCDYVWLGDRPPLDNNESLRQITHTDSGKWDKVKRELLAKGWLKKGDFLLHRGVIKTLNESKRKYVVNFNRTAKLNKLKPLVLSPPDALTGIVAILEPLPGESCATSPVTSDAASDKSESQSVIPPLMGAVTEPAGTVLPPVARRDPHLSEIPQDVADAERMAMNAGILPDFIAYVFPSWQRRGGKDAANCPAPWLSYISGRWQNEKAEWLAGTHTGKRTADKNRTRPAAPSRNAGTYNQDRNTDGLNRKIL